MSLYKKLENVFNFEDVLTILKQLDDEYIIDFLESQFFLNKYKIDSTKSLQILTLLSDKEKMSLNENDLRDDLGLNDKQIEMFFSSIKDKTKRELMLTKDEEKKIKLIENCELEDIVLETILLSFSDKNKYLMITKKDLHPHIILVLLSSFKSISYLTNFLEKHKDILETKDIRLCSIIHRLSDKQQMEFIKMAESGQISLTPKEKRYLLGSLSDVNKENIKKYYENSELPEEYKIAFDMEVNERGHVTIDFESDLEKYRGWDDMIRVCATSLSEEERKKFFELCKICPNMQINDNQLGVIADSFYATVQEYINGELWIKSVLEKIKPEWSKIQGAAFIDNAIGKKISFSPDDHTEIHNIKDTRQLWKVINSGYGVCLGISKIEQYMFQRIGLDAEIVQSYNHAFIKLKNVEIPSINGNVAIGDTIVDSTWNLDCNFLGSVPTCFCRSYKKIREQDVVDGNDTLAHKNDADLESATIDMDEQMAREIYKSIGVTIKDGHLPIELLIAISIIFDEDYPPEISMEKKLNLIPKLYPDFARHQQETKKIFTYLFDEKEYNRCVVGRVYDKNDINKEPILYLLTDWPKVGKKYYYVGLDDRAFTNITEKQFEERFAFYKADIKREQKISEHNLTVQEEYII